MHRLYWHMMGRLYEARSSRALRLHHQFKQRAEEFFRRLRGRT